MPIEKATPCGPLSGLAGRGRLRLGWAKSRIKGALVLRIALAEAETVTEMKTASVASELRCRVR